MSGPATHAEPPYSLRRTRSQIQPSVSDWLVASQSQPHPQSQSLLHTGVAHRDNHDSQSEISEHTSEQLEAADTIDGNMTSILLEIRHDVKSMNKKFDHLKKSVHMLRTSSYKSKCGYPRN